MQCQQKELFLTQRILKQSQAYVDARYVYAVATLPEYRGQKLAEQILRFAEEKYQVPLILSPAEESLIRYYENLGFKNAFQGERKNVSGSDITALEVKDTEPVACMEPVTPEEYVRIRDEKCAKEGYVHWDVDAVSYAMELAASCGGGTAAVSCEDKNTRNEQEDDRDILMYDIREKRARDTGDNAVGRRSLTGASAAYGRDGNQRSIVRTGSGA